MLYFSSSVLLPPTEPLNTWLPLSYATPSPRSGPLKLYCSKELSVGLINTEADSETVGPGWSLGCCISQVLPDGSSAVGLWAAL